MKIVGIVDSTTQNDNSHTLVKVALKYVETMKIDTTILATNDMDFTNQTKRTELEHMLDGVDALLVATTFDPDNNQTDIDDFLDWFSTIHPKAHLRAGTMMLVEPYDSLKEYNDEYLANKLQEKDVQIVLNKVFTKLEESADARSNTYILTQAMEVGELVAKELKE